MIFGISCTPIDDNDAAALAAGVVAGGAAGAGVANVAVADKDEENSKVENPDASEEEDGETTLGATSAAMVEGDDEDEVESFRTGGLAVTSTSSSDELNSSSLEGTKLPILSCLKDT